MPKSLLFQEGQTPFTQPPECQPCRTEVTRVFRKNGRLYRMTLRDKIVVEDVMIVMIKAFAFAVQTGEPYMGQVPSRAIRDFLLKQNLEI